MESVWILFHYKDSAFDYRVVNVDELKLLDVIQELPSQALKQQVLIPDVYDLYYKLGDRMCKNYIRDDGDLVSILRKFEGQDTIDIWLEDTTKPMALFKVANDLNKQEQIYKKKIRRQNEEKRLRELKEEEERSRKEIEERQRGIADMDGIQPISIKIPVVDVESNEQTYVRVYVDAQAAAAASAAAASGDQSSVAAASEASVAAAEVASSAEAASLAEAAVSEPSAAAPEASAGATEATAVPLRYKLVRRQPRMGKVPKTTAKKLGIYVPKQRKTKSVKDTTREGMRKRICDRFYKGLEFGDSSWDDSDANDFEVNSDGSMSTMSTDWIDHDGDVEILETEPVYVEEQQHLFDNAGNGDPETRIDLNPLDKAYRKGTMYVQQKWREITLEPWLIFPNKERFLSVFKDYVIQQGFVIVVNKSDRIRYTAECRYETCEWRIHASVMPDQVTWAIKKIEGSHSHKCLIKENPMADSKWLSEKLLQDVRANHKISAEALVDICNERYKLTVKKRMMFKVRKMALEQILLGSHDEPFNLMPA